MNSKTNKNGKYTDGQEEHLIEALDREEKTSKTLGTFYDDMRTIAGKTGLKKSRRLKLLVREARPSPIS